jgi:hypothetical protein
MKPPPVFQTFPRDAKGAFVAGSVHEDEQSAVDAACAVTNAGEYLEVFVFDVADESAPRIVAYVVAGDETSPNTNH